MTTKYPPNHNDEDIIEVESTSKEDKFYVEWGKESLKENISTLNDTFKLFITLDTVLLSAYLGFFEKISGSLPSFSLLKILPGVFVIASLIASIFGIFPYPVSVNLSAPQEIKKYKADRTNKKIICLAIAAITLVCGLIVLLIARISLVDSQNLIIQPTLTPTP